MSQVDHRLNPDIRMVLAAAPFPVINAASLANVRATRSSDVGVELSAAVERRNITIPGPDGGPEVTLRVHRPVGADANLGCLYWMHGGGLVIGNSQQDDLRFDKWCARHNICAVSVEYRLAPETRYPGAIDDCYVGLVWVQQHATELGIDPARIAIGGASAGAGLAAALALVARDSGLPGAQPLAQLLIYPMLDDRQMTASSKWDVPVWPPESNRFGWDSYLGRMAPHEVPMYAAPARATDLSGLPEAIIVVGALDGFVDENVDYAIRLNRAAVAVELHVYPGAPHGFDLAPESTVSRQAAADLRTWITRVFSTP
jgi:acetyl esterase/lipase